MKKIFFVLIAAMMLPMMANAQKDLVASGTCGEGLKWELNDKGSLWIYGADVAMTSFPWATVEEGKYRSQVKDVIMSDGTTICANAFRGCSNLKTVSIIAPKLTEVGAAAFGNCTSLDSIYISVDQVPTVASNAFVGMPLKDGKKAGEYESVDAKLFVPYTQMGIPAVEEGYKASNWNQMTIVSAGAIFVKKGVNKASIPGFEQILYSFSEDGVLELWAKEEGAELILEWPWESPFYMNEEITEVITHKGLIGLGTGAFLGCKNLHKAVLEDMYTLGFTSNPHLGITFFPFTECPKLKQIELYYPNGCDTPNDIMYDDLPNSFKVAATQSAFLNLKEDDFWGRFQICALPARDKGEIDNIKWIMSYDGVLTIMGEGAMPDYSSENYTTAPWYKYQQDIMKINISEGITAIGAYSFANYMTVKGLGYVVNIPTTLTAIGEQAFGLISCNIQIFCLAIQVPSLGTNAIVPGGGKMSSDINVNVWSYMENPFKKAEGWKDFTLIPLSTKSAGEITVLTTEAIDQNSILVSWPEVTGAKAYTVTLTGDHIIYTITVDEYGNILDTSTSAKAPARNPRRAVKTASGFEWVFSGLEPGSYTVTVTAYNSTDKATREQVGDPSVAPAKTVEEADTATGIDEVTGDGLQVTEKVFINGQLFILNGDKMYDAQGKMIKK